MTTGSQHKVNISGTAAKDKERTMKTEPNEMLAYITKREWFAGLAMQGLCLKSAPDYIIGDCNAAIVERAVVIADALIEQLNKEKV